MDAGRELDVLVAEKIFGHTLDYEFADDFGPRVPALRDEYDEWGMLPPYSTDISAAWQIVEHFYASGCNVSVNRDHGWHAPCECEITPDANPQRWKNGNADTMPLAICLAALAAAGVEVQ